MFADENVCCYHVSGCFQPTKGLRHITHGIHFKSVFRGDDGHRNSPGSFSNVVYEKLKKKKTHGNSKLP